MKALEEIGLSRIESNVYLTLLRLGASRAGKISKKSQINRTSTYNSLDRLLKKGLIHYRVVANEKWYECANPNRLLEFLKEKEGEVEKVLPFLNNIYETTADEHNVTLYYGYKGVKTVFQDILREAKIVYVMDSEGQLVDRMPNFAKYAIKQLDKRKIIVKYLVRKDRKPSVASKTTETRYIKKATKSNAVINIYNDKIAIFVWTDPPEVVVIKNKAATDSLADYFKMFWKRADVNPPFQKRKKRNPRI
ncbi:MAG: hypothetical protein GTN40_02920 [Candidatus Aenigmarchaeota archaeon]|nr:hypothetical protein [Candidatus Aenigmarchaeota archaeon]